MERDFSTNPSFLGFETVKWLYESGKKIIIKSKIPGEAEELKVEFYVK